jgi:hypothetical protein
MALFLGLSLFLENEPVLVLEFQESCLIKLTQKVLSSEFLQNEQAVPVDFELGL